MENDLSITFDMDELIKEKEKRVARKTVTKPVTAIVKPQPKPKRIDPYEIKQFNFSQEKNKINFEMHFENNLPPDLNLAHQIIAAVKDYLKKPKKDNITEVE